MQLGTPKNGLIRAHDRECSEKVLQLLQALTSCLDFIVCVLSAWMYMYSMYAWHLWRPHVGIRQLGTGINGAINWGLDRWFTI